MKDDLVKEALVEEAREAAAHLYREVADKRAGGVCATINAALDWQADEIERLRGEVFCCESCGANIRGLSDDYRCRGCGLIVCVSCVDVFQHFGQELHGAGDPAEAVKQLRADRRADQERVREAILVEALRLALKRGEGLDAEFVEAIRALDLDAESVK